MFYYFLQPYNQIYVNPVVNMFIPMNKSWCILIMITFENENRPEWTKNSIEIDPIHLIQTYFTCLYYNKNELQIG